MTPQTSEFAARWEEYKRAVISNSRERVGPIAACSVMLIVVSVIGQIAGRNWIAFAGLGVLGLIYSQRAKYSIWSIVLDSLMVILVGVLCVSIPFASRLRELRTPVLLIALIIYESYLIIRVIQQIRFRTSSIEGRVVGDVHYPIVIGNDAFEWFAKKLRRAGELVSASRWPEFAKYVLPNIERDARFFCEVCNGQVQVAEASQMARCSRCPQAARVLVIYDKPFTSSDDEDEWRVPCTNCGAMILRATAGRYDGRCAHCPFELPIAW